MSALTNMGPLCEHNGVNEGLGYSRNSQQYVHTSGQVWRHKFIPSGRFGGNEEDADGLSLLLPSVLCNSFFKIALACWALFPSFAW
jgi:hypothetical protein